MSTQSLLHNKMSNFEKLVSHDPVLSIFSTRVIGLLTEACAVLKDSNPDKERLSTLSDESILSELSIFLSENRAVVSERELNKILKRTKAKQDFMKFLMQFGGVYKAGDVAKLLGVSRQTVTNQRNNGKLIAIASGHNYLFPVFQFDDSQKLLHLDKLITALGSVSDITKCSFLLNPLISDDSNKSPHEWLVQGVSTEQLSFLEREATLLGTGIPA